MSSRRELLRPRWIVAHVMIVAVVVTFPQLGMWQWRRYHEETDKAARLEARVDADPVPLTSLVTMATDDATAAEIEDTAVTATGTYALDEQVFQRNRQYGGAAGYDVLTPLVLDTGEAVLVRRGWVPPARLGATDPAPAPGASGTVTVRGYLEQSGRQPSGLGPKDPETGTLTLLFNADVARIDRQTSASLLPMILHLTDQDPEPAADAPKPQPPPTVDASSNLSYTFQWFAFTAIAIIGYAVVLWRKLRGTPGAQDDLMAPEAATEEGTDR